MSRLLNEIVLVLRSENMVMEYESWKGSTVLLVTILLVTSGGYRGFQQSEVQYKWLDLIITNVAQGDKECGSKYMLQYLAKKFEEKYISVAK